MREEIQKTHHVIIPDKFEDCEGCVQLLALFEKEMNEIIGEVEFEHYYRSDVRKEQRERLKKLLEAI